MAHLRGRRGLVVHPDLGRLRAGPAGPVVGVDGTAVRRKGAAGAAHVKTGLLTDVRAVAGYVLAVSGRRYVVVSIINHANAGGAQRAHDALLDWVHREG